MQVNEAVNQALSEHLTEASAQITNMVFQAQASQAQVQASQAAQAQASEAQALPAQLQVSKVPTSQAQAQVSQAPNTQWNVLHRSKQPPPHAHIPGTTTHVIDASGQRYVPVNGEGDVFVPSTAPAPPFSTAPQQLPMHASASTGGAPVATAASATAGQRRDAYSALYMPPDSSDAHTVSISDIIGSDQHRANASSDSHAPQTST